MSLMALRTQSMKRKRPCPTVHGGLSETFSNKDNDINCPICFEMLMEPYMTKCGHTFCHLCIVRSLEVDTRCPKCSTNIEKRDDVFPNFLIAELVSKQKVSNDQKKRKLPSFDQGLPVDVDNLDIDSINDLLLTLSKRKEFLQQKERFASQEILKDFLRKALEMKNREMDKIKDDVNLLRDDLSLLEEGPTESIIDAISWSSAVVPSTSSSLSFTRPSVTPQLNFGEGVTSVDEGFNTCTNNLPSLSVQRSKLDLHFNDLLDVYFSIRKGSEQSLPSFLPTSSSNSSQSLRQFSESLNRFTRFSKFRVLSSLNYHSDICNTNSIVSSIEFDKDCEYFAIAGVTKKIKVFDYSSVIKDQIDVHYPVAEMLCGSKISSVIWNCYHKNLIASSDYEGIVCVWDAFAGSKVRVFEEHEKRCWSVDFNRVDPCLLASGSDDSRVKFWHTNTVHSVASLEVKANVCGVKFNPDSLFHLAFGSADHCIHYYDLRQLKEPLMVLKGHKKAVSYAKFINSNEIVSASTDSQLKLWDISKQTCTRTFMGHTNERNFVGLATEGDYVACGSENNSIYIFCKGLSRQMLTYKFERLKSVLNEKSEDETNEFVSAVCWKTDTNVILAANSQGIIKILEMT